MLLHSNKQSRTLILKRVQEGARNCLKLQSINHFTIAACGNGIEFHSVLLFIDPSRLAKHFRLNKDSLLHSHF